MFPPLFIDVETSTPTGFLWRLGKERRIPLNHWIMPPLWPDYVSPESWKIVSVSILNLA